MKKICIVTGSRAEYGLLRNVISGVSSSAQLSLQLVVTGSHLSPIHGLTFREIEEDGYQISDRIEILMNSDSAVGVSKAAGLALIGFSESFSRLSPDLVVVLGDRFEVLAAATAALFARIPIAHIHGGESTEGAFDEAIRHSVTKMSQFHFVAADEYAQRVIQLGECPERVYNVGSLGIDAARSLSLFTRAELEESLDFQLGARNLLVTFHPETLSQKSPAAQISPLLSALSRLDPNVHLMFTGPNADTGGDEIRTYIRHFVEQRPYAKFFESLGQKRFLSSLKFVDGVVGNSSSGLIEAPAFGTGTVNIGNRQTGRLKASSIIDCEGEEIAIFEAIEKLMSPDFRNSLSNIHNPYGDANASAAIIKIIECESGQLSTNKTFFDLPLSAGPYCSCPGYK